MQNDLPRAAHRPTAKRRRHRACGRLAAAIPRADRRHRHWRRKLGQILFLLRLGDAGADAAPTAAPAPGSQEVAAGGGGYTLNFENTPVANVAKSVLGDILGVGYVIDPRAQGSITLSSGRPIAKKDMLFVLENALHANNLNMVRDASGYRIVPANDGGMSARSIARRARRRRARVRHDRYSSAICLRNDGDKTVRGLRYTPWRRPDRSNRQAPDVVGTGSERQIALDTVRSFDVDWLQGQSVGMYPVKNSTPEPIVGELEKIMDTGDSGLGHGLVKFQAVARLNSILVVAVEARAAAGRRALDIPAGRAVGGERERQGLQSAIRRREADCARC